MKKDPNAIERRFVSEEMRLEEIDGKPRITGYSALFNVLSEDLGGFREQIAPGTFANTIAVDDIRTLWNHNPDFVLGRNASRTMSLSEDAKGLLLVNEPPDTQWARDLTVSIKRRDVTQQSFGFRTISDRWETRSGKNFRTLLQVRLFDAGPVTFPAYPSTDVAARSLMLEVADLDPELVLSALVRAERSLETVDGDEELLRAAGEKITALARRRHWTPNAERQLLEMRRRLDLEAASLGL